MRLKLLYPLDVTATPIEALVDVSTPGPAPLPILAPPTRIVRVGTAGRAVAAGVAVACLLVLLAAAYLTPDPAGVGTTTRLGLVPCTFLSTTGLPCAGCGLTTSFNHAVRWEWLKSLWTQPLGTLLTVATAGSSWVGGYIAFTGRPVHRLLARAMNGSEVRWIIGLVGFGVVAWGWKIAVTLLGIDGTNW